MEHIFENFVHAGYTYSFEQGPNKIRSHEDARQNGLNCVALAHLVMKDLFQYDLPVNLNCLELFLDIEYFEPVGSVDRMQQGDLVWFGFAKPTMRLDEFVPVYDEQGDLRNWSDVALRHVGVCTGKRNEDDEPLILHATKYVGTAAIWPLQKFQDYKQYGKIYGVSRLKKHNQDMV